MSDRLLTTEEQLVVQKYLTDNETKRRVELEGQVADLLGALQCVTRILEAFSYTTQLSKNQQERLDAARALIAKVQS